MSQLAWYLLKIKIHLSCQFKIKPFSWNNSIIEETIRIEVCPMAVKFTKTDDLDKMFEEFAKLPDLKQVTFPDDKEKKDKAEKKK